MERVSVYGQIWTPNYRRISSQSPLSISTLFHDKRRHIFDGNGNHSKCLRFQRVMVRKTESLKVTHYWTHCQFGSFPPILLPQKVIQRNQSNIQRLCRYLQRTPKERTVISLDRRGFRLFLFCPFSGFPFVEALAEMKERFAIFAKRDFQ